MMVGFDPIDSSKILFGIATVGSFLTMYIFLRRFIGQLPATAGAMIYTLFPYHAINTYVRGALSEQFGYLIIPLIFMALLKLLSKSSEKKSFYWALLLGLFGGLLILSHNLSALMCAIVLVPVVIGGVFIRKIRNYYLDISFLLEQLQLDYQRFILFRWYLNLRTLMLVLRLVAGQTFVITLYVLGNYGQEVGGSEVLRRLS